MKLFLVDEKHAQIIGELPISSDTNQLEQVIEFLALYDITNRYKRLVIAESARVIYEEDFPSVVYEGEV